MNLEPIITPIHGWCTPEKAQILFDLVIKSDSKLSIELGVFGGRSLVPLALAHKQKGTGFVIGIDPWKKEEAIKGTLDEANNEWWKSIDLKAIYNSCQHHIEKNELESHCETLRLTSQSVAAVFNDNSIDILHQDSNHNKETILSELKAWIPKLKVGGYWIADDTDWVEAREGYDHLADFGLELVENHIHWQIWKKVR